MTEVAELDGAITCYFSTMSPSPPLFCSTAVAFPLAEWACIRWAFAEQGVPHVVLDALSSMYGPMQVEIDLNGRPTVRRMNMTCGISQGCLVSGMVWALLYDPIAMYLWAALPRGDLWLTVFANDIAPALRNVFWSLRRARRALDVAGVASAKECGDQFHPTAPRIVVQGIACDGNGFPVSGMGTCLGFVLGSELFAQRLAAVRAKVLSRASHVDAWEVEIRWGDLRTVLFCLPAVMVATVAHAALHYVVARHRPVAQQGWQGSHPRRVSRNAAKSTDCLSQRYPTARNQFHFVLLPVGA